MISSTEKEIREIIVEKLGVREDSVVPMAELISDLGADSLDLVELQMALEDEFNLELFDDEVKRFKTVNDVVKYIESKV